MSQDYEGFRGKPNLDPRVGEGDTTQQYALIQPTNVKSTNSDHRLSSENTAT